MKKVFNKQNLLAVILGVFGCLVYDFLKPLFSLLAQGGNTTLHIFRDAIYFNMALDNGKSIFYCFASMMFGAISGLFTWIIIVFCLKKKIKNIVSTIDNPNTINKFIKIISIVLYFILLVDFAVLFYCDNTYIKFKNDMIAIKPYISAEQFDMINSNWTQMKSYNDFKKIRKYINQVKKENKLQ